jgi:sensor histidine kinase YesM
MLPVQPAGHSNKGIGLNNVIKRLELIYGDKYELVTGINGDAYLADLKIRLK